MLASQLRVNLNNQQREMLAMVQNIVVTGTPPVQEIPAEEAPVQQAENATIGANVQLQVL